MDDIQVSICCLVYNHEKYLRQCLDGFMMQKGVTFEVLIHDDASTDHSADIIREYEAKYPDIIKPIYQKENQHSKKIPISFTFQYPRAKGKYIALCEGDDFWTDENKLRLQYEAMENHKDCSFSVHGVQAICENGFPNGQKYPPFELKHGTISTKDFFSLYNTYGYYFQTSSYFYKSEIIKQYYTNPPCFVKEFGVGDHPLLFYGAINGNIFYLDKIMSCYRQNSIGSWSSRNLNDSERLIAHLERMINGMLLFEEYTENKHLISDAICKRKLRLFLLKKEYADAYQIIKENRKLFGRRIRLSVFIHAKFPEMAGFLQRLKHGKQQ